jgi:hypothetical protein
MKSISKKEIALTQLRRSIELFGQEDFICAITLAGAADEILTRIAESHGKNSAAKNIKTIKDQLVRIGWLESESLGEIRKDINKVKNELKHFSVDEDVSADFREEALEMITGALMNYQIAYEELPIDKSIVKFWKEK